jgi:diguanylate cyclase (GGDEF)-like protein
MCLLGYRIRPSSLVAMLGSVLFALACIFCIGGAFTLGRIISTGGAIRATLALQSSRAISLLALVDQETGVRGYVTTGKPRFLDIYRSGVSAYALESKLFAESPSVNGVVLNRYSHTLTSSALVERYLEGEIALVASGRTAFAKESLAQGNSFLDSLRASDKYLQTAIRLQLLQERAAYQQVLDFALGGIWLSGGILVLLGMALVVLVRAIRDTEGEAHIDELTGLANRRVLQERLDLRGRCAAIALVDLDDFKHVNDDYGHQVGDALLVAVAQRLRGVVRAGDLLSRLGGDEFAIVFESDDSAALVARIRDAFREPFTLSGNVGLTIGCSVGVGMPFDGTSGSDLIRLADECMFADKRRRRARLKPLLGRRAIMPIEHVPCVTGIGHMV